MEKKSGAGDFLPFLTPGHPVFSVRRPPLLRLASIFCRQARIGNRIDR
ncbi:hypothetical protein [Bacteroides xylanisolvens]|nr:hypothetical protein [Bacteroides xylanisolvens]MBX9093493.1 hypothetical protein [Bacteroides xylanisolvens]